MTELSRRALLSGGAALAVLLLTRCGRAPTGTMPAGRLSQTYIGGKPISLRAHEQALSLQPGGTSPGWIYNDMPFPVLRLAKGEALDVTLTNGLAEHTSIHWHGVRGPNAMDGVPYLTQQPVQPGASFRYGFTPPDTGTFFFHPHCDTAQQFGRGLAGILIVDGDETEPFDDDIVCVLKDWRVAQDGGFLPFVTPEGAARSGTYGTLRTANALPAPEITVPAGANIRLRVLNVDATRVGEIGIEGADGAIIAIDGNGLEPLALNTWRLGPAMRMDIALRTPAAGGKVLLQDYFAAEPVTLATLVAEGESKRSDAFTPVALKAPALPEPDLNATLHEMKLSASAVASTYPDVPPIVLPDGTTINVLDSLCSTARTFWAIDGKTWPQAGHENVPPPLLDIKRGETMVLEFLNTTPHLHPMHLHGHTFKVLSVSKLKRPVHWADTVLVLPDERVRIAFVADNPGNWMLHCHIIEHQDTGMMGWFRVA